MCGTRFALCSAPNAHPFKKLYDRTLRVAVFFCLLRPPFAQPHGALPPILVCKTIKTACNASTSSASSYQISILKRPLALKVQHYGYSSVRRPATAMHGGSTLDDALHDLHPGCVYLAVMHSGLSASFEWERASLLPPGPPTNHAQGTKPPVTRPPHILPVPVANLLVHLLLHTTPLIRMKLTYNAYLASDSSYQKIKLPTKKPTSFATDGLWPNLGGIA